MKDKFLPQAIDQNIVEPVSFPDQNEICKRLDEFYRASGIELEIPPSQMFLGALYAMRREYSKDNPDWMAQVAHSLREVLYKFDQRNKRGVGFEKYGSTYDEKRCVQEIGRYYNFKCLLT